MNIRVNKHHFTITWKITLIIEKRIIPLVIVTCKKWCMNGIGFNRMNAYILAYICG